MINLLEYGAVGTGHNFENVLFKDIALTRKPSDNLCLKGAEGVSLENIRLLPYEDREQKITAAP